MCILDFVKEAKPMSNCRKINLLNLECLPPNMLISCFKFLFAPWLCNVCIFFFFADSLMYASSYKSVPITVMSGCYRPMLLQQCSISVRIAPQIS
jgi:hypothetical protein